MTGQTRVVGVMEATIVDVRARRETVVARLELTMHGSESGIDFPGEIAQVVEVADGRIQRVSNFFTWADALEAAGLSE